MSLGTKDWVGAELAAGRYTVLSELGAGGMAFVYLAHDREENRKVVVKVPRPAMLEDADFAGRFVREGKSLVRLVHPNIVKIFDAGEHAGRPFLIMGFLPGGSLGDRLVRGRLPMSDLQTWLAGIASALDFCHANDCVHRDVKPDNILFDAQGQAYLSDFGIAKVMSKSPKTKMTVLTSAGMVLGTAQYMAPELVMGKKYDGKADQYGLAVTVYECLAGQTPYTGNTPMAVIVEQSTKDVPPLQSVNPAVSQKVANLVHRALAKDPAGRFADCTALAQAVLAEIGVAEAPVPESPNVTCPGCGKQFNLPPAAIGKKLRCPACKTRFGERDTRNAPAPDDPSADPRQNVGCGSPTSVVVSQAADSTAEVIPPKVEPVARRQAAGQASRPPRRRTVRRWWLWLLVAAGAGILALGLIVLIVAFGYGARRDIEKGKAEKQAQPTEGKGPKPGDVWTNPLRMKFAFVPAGSFWMGGGGGTPGDKQVTIPDGFYLGIYHVTQSEWRQLMDFNPSHFSRGRGGAEKVRDVPDADLDRLPVENVSWNDAHEFIRRLNNRAPSNGWLYRLPREDEWEYACRGGAPSREECSYNFYFNTPTNDLSSDQANFDGNSPAGNGEKGVFRERTTKVGSFEPNRLGLFDMHGNVLQFCENLDSKRGGPALTVRGGFWGSEGINCRAGKHNSGTAIPPSLRRYHFGFRVARVPVR